LQPAVTQRYGRPVSEAEPDTEARRIAEEARDRARFEDEALGLADQVYRVARRLVGSREEAEDLVQETYARAFRSWRSFTPGTNMRAWLLRILTNLNVDRGRRIQRTPQTQPLEESD
jgi:RNA polymerase sigma-70 factor, ECF subfamily